jgi:hypothetical protein
MVAACSANGWSASYPHSWTVTSSGSSGTSSGCWMKQVQVPHVSSVPAVLPSARPHALATSTATILGTHFARTSSTNVDGSACTCRGGLEVFSEKDQQGNEKVPHQPGAAGRDAEQIEGVRLSVGQFRPAAFTSRCRA